jgi:N5-(cytidine 5'-diphosphoramidyl)-L-glutamine hydrolase
MVRRIGITMRITGAMDYFEPRDCLAQDWWTFLLSSFPDIQWMGLPNIGNNIQEYVSGWELDGVILSGGKDVGSVQQRDMTETSLMELAVRRKLPILGVCRGMQMLNFFFGGSNIEDLTDTCGKPDTHVATNHRIKVELGPYYNLFKLNEIEVNSFHRQGVTRTALAPILQPFAYSMDGLVEGLYHSDLPIIGIQWHPERKNPAHDADLRIMEKFLRI